MTNGNTQRIKELLLEKEAELAAALRRREGIEVEARPDAIDEVQLATERELVISTLDSHSALLRQVRGALTRLEEGSYGTCLHCDTEISSKRLAALPWAVLCLRCQEEADRLGAAPEEDFDGAMRPAA